MTLGEFRKYTEHLDDSIELSYYYAGDNFPIGTMNPIGDYKIEFCSNNYDEHPSFGCLQVMAFLKRKSINDDDIITQQNIDIKLADKIRRNIVENKERRI